MQTNIHFKKHIAQLLLEWEMFRANLIQKVKTLSMSTKVFLENRAVREILWNYIADRGRTYRNTSLAQCMLIT
jgi:hypothetical protein